MLCIYIVGGSPARLSFQIILIFTHPEIRGPAQIRPGAARISGGAQVVIHVHFIIVEDQEPDRKELAAFDSGRVL